MVKMKAHIPAVTYKNYTLPTAKPFKSDTYYKEKVWTVQEHIYQKLKKISEFLETLYPTLSDKFSKNIKGVVEKNIKILFKDLDLLQSSFHKEPESFNTKKLNVNQHSITEMKNVCDTLQTISTYEYESKNLGKIKHVLNELEHLIQPTKLEKSLEKARAKSKPKTATTKKKPIPVKAKKVIKEKHKVEVKIKKKTLSKTVKKPTKLSKPVKKTTSTTKLSKPIKVVVKQSAKSKTAGKKLKPTVKKVIKPKTKISARR